MSRPDIPAACAAIDDALCNAQAAFVELHSAFGSTVPNDAAIAAFAKAALDMAGAISGIADDVQEIRNLHVTGGAS